MKSKLKQFLVDVHYWLVSQWGFPNHSVKHKTVLMIQIVAAQSNITLMTISIQTLTRPIASNNFCWNQFNFQSKTKS